MPASLPNDPPLNCMAKENSAILIELGAPEATSTDKGCGGSCASGTKGVRGPVRTPAVLT